MSESIKSYAYCLPRHFRYIILVPISIEEKVLRQIFLANLHIWGGRYNPIIPVSDNKISDQWKVTIQDYDPDVIYHSKGIDINELKKSLPFHAREYIELIDHRSPYFPGINIHSLLHHEVDGKIIRHSNLKLLHTVGSYEFNIESLGFYKLNLGIIDLYQDEDRYIRNYDVKVIDKDNYSSIFLFAFLALTDPPLFFLKRCTVLSFFTINL